MVPFIAISLEEFEQRLFKGEVELMSGGWNDIGDPLLNTMFATPDPAFLKATFA